MSEILKRHRVNVVNISVRHAYKDPGSLLAWAREETFAFVLYYKQRTRINARERVAVWTRELINAVIAHDGAYYLPYQPHATPEQFHLAYPNAEKLFANKRQYDPNYRFRNCLWEKYYSTDGTSEVKPERSSVKQSEFHQVYGDTIWRDRFYLFLQNIFHLYPEDRFHAVIMQACNEHEDDAAIYERVQSLLPDIRPAFRDLRYDQAKEHDRRANPGIDRGPELPWLPGDRFNGSLRQVIAKGTGSQRTGLSDQLYSA